MLRSPFSNNADTAFVMFAAGATKEANSAMHDIWKHMFVMGFPWRKRSFGPDHRLCLPVVSLRLSGKRELVQLKSVRSGRLANTLDTVQNAIIGRITRPGRNIAATSLLGPTISSFASSRSQGNSTSWSKQG